MSENNAFGFAKLVPGFDFLQGLAKGAADKVPQLPNLSNWVAPTINVEELDKRITELKSVQFWLEQNSRALAATIQALEVQKMTLATLQGMNFNMGDVANAFKLKAADTVASGVQKAGETVASAAQAVSGVAARAADVAAAAPAAVAEGKAAAAIDPLQWWGALTSQFQQIAASALKEGALDATKNVATGLAKEAFKTATDMATQIAAKGVQTMQEAAGVKGAPAAQQVVGAAVKGVAKAAVSTAVKSAAKTASKTTVKTAAKTTAKAAPAAAKSAGAKKAPAKKASAKSPAR